MLIQANNVSLSLDALLPDQRDLLASEAAAAVGVKPVRIKGARIVRKAVDARKKTHVHFVVNLVLDIEGCAVPDQLRPKKGVQVQVPNAPVPVTFPDLAELANAPGTLRPVVVGAGPAGLFCALALARAGLKPLLVERGRPVDERLRDVQAFADGGPLDEQSNIQFGEGGAGTFSDGKLTTGTKSPFARFVLEEFAACGAPEDILIDAKPHIGTDFLPDVVRTLRQRIIEAGGDVRFNTQLTSLDPRPTSPDLRPSQAEQASPRDLRSKGFSLCPSQAEACAADGPPPAEACAAEGVTVTLRNLETGAEEAIETNALVLACGHSARDTYQMLLDAGVAMERKPFAMGVRIEHAQAAIDRVQYGAAAGHPALPPADYKLAVHNANGRGVYTFCMCPGGEVVAAASEAGGVCTNGMSNHARSGCNANAALLVEVRPDDLPQAEGVLAGMRLQRQLERAAYQAGGGTYAAPAQTVASFMNTGDGSLCSPRPTYPRGVREADLHDIFPAFMTDALTEALPNLGRKLKGFDAPDALMTAVEARSSSPVRLMRHKRTLQSITHPGVYPAGEGGGHAGGIMSAACDGLRVASAIMEDAQLRAAAAALEQGRAAVFPTDTVAGIGVSVMAAPGPQELARIKGREADKPVAWLVATPDALDVYGKDVSASARELAAEGWPGALTLVVRANENVPEAFQSAQGTIGLRMPASRVACRLIEEAGAPLAVTSANLAGEAAPLGLDAISATFAERAEAAGAAFVRIRERATGTASRVVDCTGSEPVTLR